MDWVHRKQTYLTRLEFEEPDGALLVSVADKVHNARAIVTDLQSHGVAALEKFHRPDLVLWYYDENLRIATSGLVPDALLKPLETAVALLHDELGQLA